MQDPAERPGLRQLWSESPACVVAQISLMWLPLFAQGSLVWTGTTLWGFTVPAVALGVALAGRKSSGGTASRQKGLVISARLLAATFVVAELIAHGIGIHALGLLEFVVFATLALTLILRGLLQLGMLPQPEVTPWHGDGLVERRRAALWSWSAEVRSRRRLTLLLLPLFGSTLATFPLTGCFTFLVIEALVDAASGIVGMLLCCRYRFASWRMALPGSDVELRHGFRSAACLLGMAAVCAGLLIWMVR